MKTLNREDTVSRLIVSRRRRLSWLGQRTTAIALGVLALLALGQTAKAEVLPVSAIRVVEQDTYRIQRVYAGELHHARASQLGFEFGGRVESVMVEEGEAIRQGDVLAMLDSAAMQANVKAALANLETARANILAHEAQIALSSASLKRYEDLVARGHGSEQELDELQARHRVDKARDSVFAAQLDSAVAAVELAQANLDKYTIRAPYSGVVQSRTVDEGSIVAPGQNVLAVVESGRLEARVGVPETMAQRLGRDTIYDIRAGGREVQARLTGVLPVADGMTGTVTALFEIADDSLFAGTLTELSLNVDVPGRGYWVPVTALSESQRGLWSVLVINDEGDRRFVEARLVEILYRGKDRVFVQGTLEGGELVVAGGTSRIVPGQDVQVATIDGAAAR